ncbi:hypothetical protein ACLOJK_002841 [Asimina triloba]
MGKPSPFEITEADPAKAWPRLSSCFELIGASESSRFRSKHRVYSVTVRRLAAANLHHFVVDIFEHHKQFPEIATEGFAARLISLYGQAGMFSDASKLFDELPQLKCPRTVKSINAVLTAALDLS